MNTLYTIYRYDPVTRLGEILRSGQCPAYAAAKQVRAGESILVGQALCDIQHFIRHDEEGRKQVHRHPPEVIAKRAPHGWIPPTTHLLAGLAAKGINPDLAARHIQRRRHHAAVMHEAGKSPAGARPVSP